MARIVLWALAGALAMVGAWAEEARAVQANPDEIVAPVNGSTLTIKISDLLANDTPGVPKVFLNATKNNLSAGIKSLSFNKKKGIIKVTLKKGFTGNTGFRYRITSTTRPRDFSVTNVFIVASPN